MTVAQARKAAHKIISEEVAKGKKAATKKAANENCAQGRLKDGCGSEFPWSGGRDEESALRLALNFLEERYS